MDRPVAAKVEPAIGDGLFRPAALDHEDRDIRPALPQLVGDPGKGVDALFVRGVDHCQESRVALLGSNSVRIDQVRQDDAIEPEDISVVVGREP